MSYKPKTNHIGEKRMQNCGLEAEIVEYRKTEDIDVKFPDGTIAKHRAYSNFKRGSINHPGIDRYKRYIDQRTGKKRVQNCGLEAEIIRYRNANDIDVRFPDGTVAEHRAYDQFINRSINHPGINRYKRYIDQRTSEKRVQNCGLEAEIIRYRNVGDIDVRFPDKTIVEHRTYDNFKNGFITHPDVSPYKKQNKRIGEKRIQNCGLEAEIIKYHNAKDIDLIFSDGSTTKHKDYQNFTEKIIGHPTIYGLFHKDIGKIYPKGRSKIYHTKIHGIAYIIDDTYYYFCRCPICQAHEIWTFDEIKSHKCNQELAKERDEFIQTLKTQSNVPAT